LCFNGRVIADRLSGQRIAVTGATGFVGTALVERLLRSMPGCDVVVLVRNGRRTSAADRVRKEILKNNAFESTARRVGRELRRHEWRVACRWWPATWAPTVWA